MLLRYGRRQSIRHSKNRVRLQAVLKYLTALQNIVGNDVEFVCGYEAGCLDFTLYHQLTSFHINCIILAPTTMMSAAKKGVKTDKRDAANIAKCLAYRTYSPVHIPTKQDEQVKEEKLVMDGARMPRCIFYYLEALKSFTFEAIEKWIQYLEMSFLGRKQ